MAKLYTRLKINETYRAANTDDLADLGGFSVALKKGQVSYSVTIYVDDKLVKTEKNVFNAKGESIDHWHEFEAKSFKDAASRMTAFWQVFIGQHRVWFNHVKQLFDHSIQSGRSPQSGGGSALWSVANIAMSKAHSMLSKAGQVNQSIVKISACPHQVDGAIQVAEYIVREIKNNVKSGAAETMRELMDYDGKKRKAWEALPLWQRGFVPMPTPSPGVAYTIWTKKVFKDQEWDHKWQIRDNKAFNSVAIPRKGGSLKGVRENRNNKRKVRDSKSYWHKYKRHDYFYDVWSNIHFGYVGLACGFDQRTLLWGGARAQLFDEGRVDGDAPDDQVCIKIGFTLFKQFGMWAENLTAQAVLDALEQADLNESRETHVCYHPNREEIENNGSDD